MLAPNSCAQDSETVTENWFLFPIQKTLITHPSFTRAPMLTGLTIRLGVGRASSGSDAAGPEAAASWAVCVSLAARRSPQGSLPTVCVYYCRTYYKAVRGGGRRRVDDMCYERRRAEACVDESAHHALANTGGRVIVGTTSRMSPAVRSSGRLPAARRSRRRCRLARTRPEKPVRSPGGGGRLGWSRLSCSPPVAPGSPQPTSMFPTIVLPMFGARRRTLVSILCLRPVDTGVCASRSGGGTSDNRTLPQYSP
jgi:hypothetical protein